MGTINTVTLEKQRCQNCGNLVPLKVQFRFGSLDLLEYSVGDSVKWDVSDLREGTPGMKKVLLNGAAYECSSCGQHVLGTEHLVITLENDVIKSIGANQGEFPAYGDDFHVVER